MKHFITTSLALAASVTLVTAESLTFDFKDPKGVNNVIFKLDAPLESINGTANGISGTVQADPDNPEDIKGKIIVSAKSLTVPNPVMLEHMHGEEWLDVETHPEIIFEAKEVMNAKHDGTKGTADVKGTFTLKGVSKEITVPVEVTYLPGRLADRTNGKQQGDLLVIRSKFSINRGDFGIKEGENLDKVSDAIDIEMSIAGAAPKP
jgi:polyisoprenoid-binding protein YceI